MTRRAELPTWRAWLHTLATLILAVVTMSVVIILDRANHEIDRLTAAVARREPTIDRIEANTEANAETAAMLAQVVDETRGLIVAATSPSSSSAARNQAIDVAVAGVVRIERYLCGGPCPDQPEDLING